MKKVALQIMLLLSLSSLLRAQVVGHIENDTLVNYVDINMKKQGRWQKSYDSGTLKYTGNFRDDRPVGIFRYYHPNGRIKSILDYDQRPLIAAQLFWPSGDTAAIGSYDTLHRRVGAWRLFFDDGSTAATLYYENGKATGEVKMFYPKSEIMVLNCEYRHGKLNGFYKKYFSNGNLQEDGHFVDNDKTGHWRYFNPDGTLREEGEFVAGRREGDWTNYEKSAKGEVVNYVLGRPENYNELQQAWTDTVEWAKKNQDKFKNPQDYLDNPIEFFKP